MQPIFNISTLVVGGIRFLKIGRFCFSFCVTRSYKPVAAGAKPRPASPQLEFFR